MSALSRPSAGIPQQDLVSDPVPEQDIVDSLSWQHVLFPDGHLASRASSFASLKSLVESSSEEEEDYQGQDDLADEGAAEGGGSRGPRGAGGQSMLDISCDDSTTEISARGEEIWISLPREVRLEGRRRSQVVKAEGKEGMLLGSLRDAMKKRGVILKNE
ncbi:hypothetical protein GUITHDRAFT_131603 [Guillardia theta CCMP2712]|uniref:Uncharacterized protein n=2 Tax=Guillardia theta TaxID=55529 RepID=L1K470_GUITC|nr:hypothetical protein GUITHDRAFT_131603 [Guillardia theta CCMP2712]EKX55389.1 hypothetical protein GUITHDRAFT_131603 [Guillardia theta CCMP2712]|mmetsp:Transcript_22673/g.74183  ORF Transcript_22673/g.74183 Transcript_22673/m.74183 type:complete len:160 (+) Transcript_22673:202-681(+)|eukprot:XP_005842369.1 hypothetical protein GUITHDRAFT_131603 [Guillardia theta CCMP2712]